MKLLLSLVAVVAFSVLSYGQTLKWEYSEPPPGVVFNSRSFSDIHFDTAGNIAFTSQYFQNEDHAGSQLIWLNASGKPIHVTTEPPTNVRFSKVVLVSANQILVELSRASGAIGLRRYYRKNGTVTFSDVDLTNQQVLTPAGVTNRNRNVFFTVTTNVWPRIIRRYSLP